MDRISEVVVLGVWGALPVCPALGVVSLGGGGATTGRFPLALWGVRQRWGGVALASGAYRWRVGKWRKVGAGWRIQVASWRVAQSWGGVALARGAYRGRVGKRRNDGVGWRQQEAHTGGELA